MPQGAVTGTNGVDVCHRAALQWQLLAVQIVGGSPQGSFCREVLLKVALGSHHVCLYSILKQPWRAGSLKDDLVQLFMEGSLDEII